MLIAAHRKNTIEELRQTPTEYGVEIDLRTHDGHLILQHDPFSSGILFEKWLEHFHHRFLILNVKEDGLEKTILDLLTKKNIHHFFFLDQAMPTLIKTVRGGEKRVALRFSEYESVETILHFSHKADWVWVDCFTSLPLNPENHKQLRTAGFKLCLVSPELQGRLDIAEIQNIRKFLKDNALTIDAVCTKRPELWS